MAHITEPERRLPIASSLMGLALFTVWGLDLQQVLTHSYFGSDMARGPYFCAEVFVALSSVLFLALLRRKVEDRGTSALWLGWLSAAMTLILAALLVVGVTGLDPAIRSLLFQRYPEAVFTGSELMIATLAFVWVLHVCDAHLGRGTKTREWLSYVLMFAPISFYFHEVSEMMLGGNIGVIGQSLLLFPGNLLIALWGLVFARSPAYAMLFDARAPRSNAFSCASLGLSATVLVLLEAFVPLHGVSLVVTYALLLKLPLILSIFRPLEIEARIVSGALDPDQGQSRAKEPLLPAVSQGAAPKGYLERAIDFLTFKAPQRLRLAVQSALIFAMAFGATRLGTLTEAHVPAIWFANAYLAYLLLLVPVRAWWKTIAVFVAAVFAGMYLADPAAGTTPALSTLLMAGVHGLQGTLLGVLLRLAHGLELKERRIAGGLFDLRHVMIGSGVWFVILAVTATFAERITHGLHGGDPTYHLYVAISSMAMGAAPMIVLIAGTVVKLHFGYKDLPPLLPTGPLVIAVCTVGAAAFYALMPVPEVVAVPHIAFVLMTVPLALMPSLLQAGALLCVISLLYSGFGYARWSGDGMHFQYPFVTVMMSMLVSFTILARYHFTRLRDAEKRALTYAASALLTYDHEGGLLSISKNAQEWFECSAKDMIGKQLSGYFDNGEELRAIAVENLKKDPSKPFLATAVRTKSDGQKLYLEAYVQANTDRSLPYAVVVSLRDVTSKMVLQEEKAKIEEIVSAFMNGGPQYYSLETSDYKTVAVSQAVADDIIGLSLEDVIGRDATEFGPEDPEIVSERRYWEDLLLRRDGQLVRSYPFKNEVTGEQKYLRTHIKRIERANGDYYRSIVTEDVSDLTRALNSSEAFLRADTNAFVVQDESLRVMYFGERSLDLFGQDLKHLPDWTEVYPDFDDDTWADDVAKILSLPMGVIGCDEMPIRLLSALGVIKHVMRSYRWFPNPKGPGRLLWTSFQDVTALVNTQNKLTELVDHDELTGLHSRRSFYRNFRNGARREDAVLYMLDIDHFKSVNDGFGHDAGDAFLIACGRAFERLAEGGAAIRLGGEEFAIVRPWAGWLEARAFGEKVRKTIEGTKIIEGGRQISRSVSVGVAHLGRGKDLSETMHLADLVLREAKEHGRNKVCVADSEMLELLRSRGAFITRDEVKTALHSGEFRFNVQPIWNVAKNEISGFEALIRWYKPDGSMVMPSLFVGLLREVIRDPESRHAKNQLRAAALRKLSQFPDAYVSFNFTLDQLSYEGAAEDLILQFDTIRDHPDRVIVLELSEQAMHDRNNTAVLHHELKLLHDAGFRIALDDFGIESSNLHRLQEFPIDIVKIDKVLIDKIEDSHIQRTTLRGLVHTMNELGIDVVAEGIETPYQARLLRGMRIDKQQGYLHARPMRPEEVFPKLAEIGADLQDTTVAEMPARQKLATQST